MAKRILLPLDQTTEAEAVVQLVADAARAVGATVRLLHVAPVPEPIVGPEGKIVAYVDQEMTRLETEGLDYLRVVEVQFADVPVECVVRFGNPVEEILAEAEAFGADLIALTAPGRRRLGRLIRRGTVAEVWWKAAAPVVVYRTGGINDAA